MKKILFEITGDKALELQRLMESTNLKTYKDLINNALTLFEWAIQERFAGREIASVDESEQSYKTVQLPALTTIEQKPVKTFRIQEPNGPF